MSTPPPPAQHTPVKPAGATGSRQRPQSAHVRRSTGDLFTNATAAQSPAAGNRSPSRIYESPRQHPYSAAEPTNTHSPAASQQQGGEGGKPKRPTSAQVRWGEKRKLVKSSSDVLKEVAERVRESHSRVLRERNEHVRVCDRPESGKFNTIFHRKINLDLQLEAHRTLMNTRFSADGERLVEEEAPAFSFRDTPPSQSLEGDGDVAYTLTGPQAAAAGSGSFYASAAVDGVNNIPTPPPAASTAARMAAGTPDAAAQDMQRIISSGAGSSKRRPVSARTARTTASSRTAATIAGRSTAAQSAGAGMSVVGQGLQYSPRNGSRNGSGSGTGRPQFNTVWHEPRCDDMRVDAMHNLSLGIHKEPFVPPAERVRFRCTAAEAQYPFQDARRRAESASSSRPATPRSVMTFFNVDEEAEYGAIDTQHNAEWRQRVLSKISEVDKRAKASGSGTTVVSSSRGGSSGVSQPAITTFNSAVLTPQKAKAAGVPAGAAKTQQQPSPRKPMAGTALNRAPMVVRGISSPAGKREHQQQQQQRQGYQPPSSKQQQQQRLSKKSITSTTTAHPKDVHSWNSQVVLPLKPSPRT